MASSRIQRVAPAVAIFAALCFLYACESAPDAGRSPNATTSTATNSHRPNAVGDSEPGRITASGGGEEPVSTVIDARPAAMVNGRAVMWGDLRPALSEAAGATALQEAALDRLISQEFAARGLVMGDDAPAAEQKLLLESLSPDPNTAVRLLNELRARQGLGPHRYNALVRRNAMLRALVREQVQVTDATIQRMYELRHGPRRQARIMVLPTLAAAQQAIDRVNAGESFMDVAVELSTDSSAPRGGLLEPISQEDVTYPEALRHSLFALATGELSAPILFEDRYAVIMLVREIDPDHTPIDSVRGELERLVRIGQERVLMDDLATRLLREASITVFDEHVRDSWERGRRSGGP